MSKVEKDVKTLGSESLSTLCYFLGWVGQPLGNWPPKGKFPKEELEIQQITHYCGGRCMALNGTGSQSWWCWHRGWALLLGLVCSRAETTFSPLCSIFQALGREAEAEGTEAHGARPVRPQEQRLQWSEHSGRAISGNFGGCLAWWLFLFTNLKDYSPFHQCFFEMTGSAIH